MTYQFQTIVKGEQNGPLRDSFLDAWQDMYLWVKKQLDGQGLSWQVLETCIWIESVYADGDKNCLYFPDARDKAIREYGWKKPND